MSFKENYWRYALITIIIGLGVILFLNMIPFLNGILGAFTIYILVRKQMFYLTEKRQFKPGMAALLLLAESVLCFLVPATLTVWVLINEIEYINVDTTALLTSVEHIVNLIRQKTGYNLFDLDNLMPLASLIPQVGRILIGSIGSFAFNLVVLLFVLFFMLTGGRKMENYVYAILPFKPDNKASILHEIQMIVTSNAIGIPLLAVIQGLIALAGYFIFGVPDPLTFGFLTCIATVIPIVGTALIWFPLTVYLALTGDWLNAAGLGIYALVVITNIDNLIRFVLQKKMADIHPLVTIFGVVVGLSLFGFMGIIFGPLLVSIFLLCVNLFKKEYLDEDKPSHPSTEG